MEKKSRKFSLGQRVLFEEKEYEICQIDLICDDDANIYALAKLDAEHKISVHWEECIRNGDMITNNKHISIWVKEKDITAVENSKESLLEEARRRYPKGTKYYPAHLSGDGNSICTVGDPDNFILLAGDILESLGNKEKNGHSYTERIYYNGKWAKIVTPVVEEEPAAKPEIGRYITINDSCREEVFITKVMGYYGERQLNDSPILMLTRKDYDSKNKTAYTQENRTWRYSTEDEIDHLDACIRADRYVVPDEHPDNPDFELMPEGFYPLDELITTTEFKTGEWYKYKIYSSEKWVYILVDLVKQVDTCKEVYYTQKIVDGKLVHESSSIMGTALDERLIEVDPSEIHLIISHNQYPLTTNETHSSWLNAQEEYHRQQYRYNLVMNEREILIKQTEKTKFPTLKRKREKKLVNTIVNIPTVVERIKRNK